jgi:hypothetical protein
MNGSSSLGQYPSFWVALWLMAVIVAALLVAAWLGDKIS